MTKLSAPFRKVHSLIEGLDSEKLKVLCRMLLTPYFTPIFGLDKLIEHDVAAFEAIKKLGLLSPVAEVYELIMALRVTKSKTGSLIYQAALRCLGDVSELNDALRKLIANPILDSGNAKDTGVTYPIHELAHLANLPTRLINISRLNFFPNINNALPHLKRSSTPTRW